MAKRGRKKIPMAKRVREMAKEIIAERGEAPMNQLLNEIKLRLRRKGFAVRIDYALTSIASTPGLEVRVTKEPGKKRIKIAGRKVA